jgi:hypothetical protein
MSVQWRIYYTDGSTFSSLDGSPYDAPAEDVQVLLKLDPDVGRFLLAAKDFYWFDHARQEWFGGEKAGLYQHLRQPGPSKVLFGTFVTCREYHDCVKAALSDPDFPPKTARAELEQW